MIAGEIPVGHDRNVCSAPFRVRFDEAGPDGRLRTSVLLRYAQDLAWFHSAREGFDRAWYAARGLAWLVRAAELSLDRPIGVGDALTGTTRVVGWRRVWARRRTEFRDADGALVAWVHIDWVLLDARGAPTRVPPEFAVFDAPATGLSLGRVPLKDPPVGAHRQAIVVRPQELDPMDHVNNAVYVDWLEEAIIAAGAVEATRMLPRHLRLEYIASAEPGAALEAGAWLDDDGWSYSLATSGPDAVIALRARLDGRVQGTGPH